MLAALPVRSPRSGYPVRAFFRVMWETGLRRGTLWRLTAPGDYRVGSALLHVRAEADKARYERPLPLAARAREELDAVCPDEGPIFRESDMRHHLAKAGKAIGLAPELVGHLSNHDFRHSRTTHLLDEGGSLTGVAYQKRRSPPRRRARFVLDSRLLRKRGLEPPQDFSH